MHGVSVVKMGYGKVYHAFRSGHGPEIFDEYENVTNVNEKGVFQYRRGLPLCR